MTAHPADRTDRPTIRKFNPGTLQPDQAVIDQFVVRHHELAIILDVLRGNIGAPSSQHILVVAPRGRGKTMLLARVAAELRTNSAFCRQLRPVRFMEESQEIFDLADFWLETLFHLAREIGAEDAALASELRATHASLSERWRDHTLQDLARAAVLDAGDRVGRRLVLIVENFQSLCRNADAHFGWQLRAVLQSVPEIMLVASATTRFEGLDDVDEPFFELFRSVDLKPLATDDCARLWEMACGEAVPVRQIRPLEILIGGSPRLLVIVAGFAHHLSLRSLMEELVTLIDDHTEYFRGHLEALPRSERRVYVAVIDLWMPSTTGEIAARARMDVRVVSTMLGRLIDRGVVVTDPTASGRKRLYAAAEPLFSIYYKLRRERDEAAVVESLVLFMVAFYDVHAFFDLRDRLMEELCESTPLHIGVEGALVKHGAGQDVESHMKWGVLRDASAERQLDEEIGKAIESQAWEKVLQAIEGHVAKGWPSAASFPDHDSVYFAHMRAKAYLNMHGFEKVIEIGQQTLERFRDTRDVFVLYRSAQVLLHKAAAHFNLSDHTATIATSRELVDWFGKYRDPDFDLCIAQALFLRAKAEAALDNVEPAISLLEDAVARCGSAEEPDLQKVLVRALVALADLLRSTRNDIYRVLATYDDAITRLKDVGVSELLDCAASAYLNRAFARGGIRDFEGEIASCQEFISVLESSDAAGAENHLAIALAFRCMRQAEIGQTEEALAGSQQLATRVEALPDAMKPWFQWWGMCIEAMAQTVRGQRSAALEATRCACRLFPPGDEVTTRQMIRFVLNLLAVGLSEGDLLEILVSQPRGSQALAPVIVALRQRVGEEVRAPTEMLEVAADICKGIEDLAAKGELTAF